MQLPPPILLMVYLVCILAADNEWETTAKNETGAWLVLNQLNRFTRAFNFSNKLMCDEFTDLAEMPLLNAADDFVLPLDSELAAQNLQPLSACSALQLTLSVLMVQSVQLYPGTLTVQFFVNNASNNSPGAEIYSLTMAAPDGDEQWHLTQGVPSNITLTLLNGALSDDGRTTFDFGDQLFMRRHTTLWMAFYLTSAYTESTLYWLTLDAAANSNQAPALLLNRPNYHYFYRDVTDLEPFGFTLWTDASIVEPTFEIQSGTYQMAWSMQFLCPQMGSGGGTNETTTTLQSLWLQHNWVLVVAFSFLLLVACFCCTLRALRRRRLARKAKAESGVVYIDLPEVSINYSGDDDDENGGVKRRIAVSEYMPGDNVTFSDDEDKKKNISRTRRS